MNPWPFIVAAYVLTGGGTLFVTLQSYRTMRRAEKQVGDL